MGSTDLALSWKDHHGVLFNVFEKLLAKKSLVDCTLAAEGKFLKAHRIVLSACSPYFEALLDQEHDKHPIIFLRDVQFEDLKTLLEFVYSGEIKIPENRLVEFLNVAEALQIKGLGGVGNEGQVNKSSTDVLPQRETRSPVPRKRTRRHSSSSDGSSRDRAEIIPVSSESSRPKSNSEKIVPVANNASTSEPVPRQTSVVPSEDLNPNVKVKEEIITPVQSTCSDLLSSDQSADNEEILGLKPEFEQVTFTEDYSDDMLPEDSDSVDHVIDQDQPSSSQQYSGFSAESAKAGELSIHPPFAVGGVNQPVPEGLHRGDKPFKKETFKETFKKFQEAVQTAKNNAECLEMANVMESGFLMLVAKMESLRQGFQYDRKERFQTTNSIMALCGITPQTTLEDIKAALNLKEPFENLERFEEFDRKLFEEEYSKKCAKLMETLSFGAKRLENAVDSIFTTFMAKEVQLQYSGKGRIVKGKGKKNFSATNLCEIGVGVIMEKFGETKDAVISKISRWLAGAPDREGGRKERENN